MAQSLEVLVTGEESTIGTATLHAVTQGASAAGLDVKVTNRFNGGSDWLAVFGAGEAKRGAAVARQLESERRAALFDLGYFGRNKDPATTFVRVSVDHCHPQKWMAKTAPDPSRWDALGIPLRDDYDETGHVIVVGMGPKSKKQLRLYDWELKTLRSANVRFPDKRILYRPKRDAVRIAWDQDATSPIEVLLKGASLVICRHSNVAVDACVAGIPVETEDGAAWWLYADSRNPGPEKRRDFLRRLAWWQWKLNEMGDCWRFLLRVCGST